MSSDREKAIALLDPRQQVQSSENLERQKYRTRDSNKF